MRLASVGVCSILLVCAPNRPVRAIYRNYRKTPTRAEKLERTRTKVAGLTVFFTGMTLVSQQVPHLPTVTSFAALGSFLAWQALAFTARRHLREGTDSLESGDPRFLRDLKYLVRSGAVDPTRKAAAILKWSLRRRTSDDR